MCIRDSFTRGRGSPSLWFLGHTDVVPTGPEELWTFLPFHPDQKDGELYGRGVADMKGAVAAMVVALETFARQSPDHQGQIGLLLTSDEEGEALDGIVRVAETLSQRGQRPLHLSGSGVAFLLIGGQGPLHDLHEYGWKICLLYTSPSPRDA